jgi:hypothetical protein
MRLKLPQISKWKQWFKSLSHRLYISVKVASPAVSLAICIGSHVGSVQAAELHSFTAAKPTLERVQQMPVNLLPEDVRRLNLIEKPAPDWRRSLVEFFSQVPPECQAMSKDNTKKECQDRERGVLEKFFESHPVAFNLLLSALALMFGILTGIVIFVREHK